VGIATNLIVFPASFAILQLFRRSRPRSSRRRRRTHDDDDNDSKKNNKKQKRMQLPWWCKLIGFALSFLVSIVSLFFVVIKGIEFGNEKVAKWLSSVTVSFLASMLLTQPLQLALVSLFFVTLCRKTRQLTAQFNEQQQKLDDAAFLNNVSSSVDLIFIFL
jgi:hypothetical protein